MVTLLPLMGLDHLDLNLRDLVLSRIGNIGHLSIKVRPARKPLALNFLPSSYYSIN